MSERPAYTEFHPRWHRRRMSTYWWLERRPYVLFILREVSSVFVGWFVVYLLMLVHAINQGNAAYLTFLQWSRAPLVMVLNVITLAFVTYHAITWFNLAPAAMVVQLGDKKVPPAQIIAGNYAAWAVVSVIVAWIILGG